MDRCIHGHLMVGDNLILQKVKSGAIHRRCAECKKESNKKTRLKRICLEKGLPWPPEPEEYKPEFATFTHRGEKYVVFKDSRHINCLHEGHLQVYNPSHEELEGSFFCRKHGEQVEFPTIETLQLIAEEFAGNATGKHARSETPALITCKKCNDTKSSSAFPSDGRGGVGRVCRDCKSKIRKELTEKGKLGPVKLCQSCLEVKFHDDFKWFKDSLRRNCIKCERYDYRAAARSKEERHHKEYLKYKAQLAARRYA